MNWILRLLLLLPLVASAQVEVRRYATMSDLLSANPASFAVAGRATVIVTGRTNLYDGWSRVLAYSSSDTNTADNQTIFSPANTNFPGRYRLLYLENATNSAVRAGILPAYGANSFWYNGAWTPVSNIFVAGANSTVSVATNGVVTIASVSGGEIILPVDAARITNGILSSSQLKGSDISWSVEAGTNVVATLYGSTVTFDKMQSTDPATLLGGVEGGVSQVPISPIQIGANLQMIGNTLSAIVPASTNSWQIEVGGVLTIEPDLVDTGRIDVSASGSSVSFDLVSGSVSTNYLSAGVNSLLHAHNLAFTVNGTTVIDPNVSSSEEIAAAVASSTNVYFALNPGSVALSKLTNMVASRLLGRGSSGLGAVEPITVGTGLVLGTNGVLSATGTNSTVVRVGGTTVTDPNFLDTSEVDMSIDLATNISASLFNSSVVFSKLQSIATGRLLGRSTAGSGNIETILIGSGLSLTSGTLSATGGGGGGSTNGTAVYVDGVSITDPNFTDSSTTGLFDVSGTNITIRLPSRDFGDITVSSSGSVMTIDADSVALGTDTTGNYVATVSGTANEVSVSGSGSETAAVTLSLPATIDLGGKTSFEVPNSTGPTTDAVGEIAVDSNAWATGRGALQIFDGTANTFAVGVLASDIPTNGQVPKWNTGGTITWEDDNSGSGGSGTAVTVDGSSDMARANFADSSDIGFTATSTNVTATIANDAVTFAKMQNIATSRLLGRSSGGSGDAEEIQIGSGLTLSAGVLAASGTGGTNAGSLLQVKGVAQFTINGSSTMVNEVTSGYVTDVSHDDGTYNVERGLFTVTLSPSMPDTNYVVLIQIEGEDPTGLGSPNAAVVQNSKTTSQFKFVSRFDNSADNMPAAKYLVWVLDDDASAVSPAAIYVGSTNVTSPNLANGPVRWSISGTNITPEFATNPSFTGAATNTGSFGAPVLYVGTTNVAAAVALKAPLASPSFTGDATNTGSFGAPTLYVGTTNVAVALASISGGGGNVYTSSNNVMTGTNTFSGMITLGSLSRTNFLPSATELYFFTEFLTGTSGTTTTAFLPFQGNAINSGTVAAAQGLTNHPGIITMASASGTANSGYAYTCNATALIPRPGDFFRISFKPFNTNAGVREYLGFSDQGGAASAPTDGLCIFRSNNIIYGQAWNNSVLVQTLNSASVVSNTWYSVWGHIVDDSVAQFIVTDETGASVLSDTVTNGVPFTRGYGAGIVSYYTNSPGGSTSLGQYDNIHVGSLRNILR